MKKIDGINLKSLVSIAEEELLEEKKEKAVSIIMGLLKQHDNLVKDVENRTKELEKATNKRDELATKLKAIEKGDWSLLKEDDSK